MLVIVAHPALESSRVNRALLESARQCDGVTVHDLYARYPEQMIDVRHEQALVDAHDVLVFQHPMYWYSCPALLKGWFDSVLTDGWAYGDHADGLMGKSWVQVVSTGGSASVYQRCGYNCFSIAELLRPFEQTARLCQMKYLQPFLTHAPEALSEGDLQAHAQSYVTWLSALVQGSGVPQVDSLQVAQAQYIDSSQPGEVL